LYPSIWLIAEARTKCEIGFNQNETIFARHSRLLSYITLRKMVRLCTLSTCISKW